MAAKSVVFVSIAGLLVVVLASALCISALGNRADPRASINRTLIGKNLTYYSIAGTPMNYTITPEDIVSIGPTTYDGRSAWKVRVGQGLAWDLTMDASGTKVLQAEQLFRT